MTARSILIPQGRVFSAAEIEGIIAVAQDPLCPDLMDVRLVEAAARMAESRQQNGGELLFDINQKERREQGLMTAVRAVARRSG